TKNKQTKALTKELINAVCIGDHQYVKQILTTKFLKTHDINTKTRGYTLLSIASQNGHVEVINILLGANANIDHTNDEDTTALLKASENGHFDVVKLLLDHGANIDLANNQGTTALCIAFYNGHFDVV